MALSGSLATMSVPEVLQFVGTAGKSGLLRFESGSCRKDVFLEQGDVVFCSAGHPKEMLGHHLVARTSVTEDDLHRAFERQERTGKRLGEILVEDGRLGEDELERVLREKLASSLFELFTWRGGRFAYEAVPSGVEGVPHRFDMGWEATLQEGARISDEHSRIRAIIADSRVRFRVRWQSVADEVTSDRLAGGLLTLAGQGLTTREICERLHDTDLDVLSRLTDLVEGGLLTVVPAPDSGVRAPTEAVETAARLLDADRFVTALDTIREAAFSWPDSLRVADCLRSTEMLVRSRARKILGDFGSVPTLLVRLDELADAGLRPKEAAVVARVNGAWTLASIARICPFEEIDALAALARLFQRGCLALHEPAESVDVELDAAPTGRRPGEPAPAPALPEPEPAPSEDAPVAAAPREATLQDRLIAAQRRRVFLERREAATRWRPTGNRS